MEPFQKAREDALTMLKQAEYLYSHTYPLFNDPKILAVVLEKANRAVTKTVESVLLYEHLFKRISSIGRGENEQLIAFQTYALRREELKQFLPFIAELHMLMRTHRQSPTEFARKDTYVMMESNVGVKTINKEKTKELLKNAALLLAQISIITAEHERIFG